MTPAMTFACVLWLTLKPRSAYLPRPASGRAGTKNPLWIQGALGRREFELVNGSVQVVVAIRQMCPPGLCRKGDPYTAQSVFSMPVGTALRIPTFVA